MACSIEERWKPLVKYLCYLGIRREGMKRMLILKPMVFCVDLETTIAPKVLIILLFLDKPTQVPSFFLAQRVSTNLDHR